jgi:lambda family phage minor tail protein L
MPRILPADFVSEKNKQESAGMINLYEIEYQTDTWLYLAQWDTNIVFDGKTYIGVETSVSHDKTGENREGSVEQVNISIANVDRLIGGYVETYDPRGLRANILTVFETLLDDPTARLIERYSIDALTVNENAVNLICTTVIDLMNIVLPSRRFSPICAWVFKGTECGYAGAETECNKTLTRCRQLGNSERWGGFRVQNYRRLWF